MSTPPLRMRNRCSRRQESTMESDNEKEVHEPISKRQKLDLEVEEAATTSKLPTGTSNEGGEGAGSSGNSSDNEEDQEMDRQSADSGDDWSELSNLSGLDDQCNEASWLPVAGPISWVQRQMSLGTDPRDIIQSILGEDFEVPPDFDQLKLWEMVVTLLLESTERTKLDHINTLQDVVQLLEKCHNIIVLTGAGVSVSCGIPDFRSQDGIYARLAKDFPNLPNPQSMFDIHFFKSDQRPFFKFAKEIYPGQFEPSPCHKFIRLLETKGKLLRNYTQNIDTLEKVAGVERAIECHGSFATATCMVCKYKVDKEAVRKDIFDQVIPHCPKCGPDVKDAVMKPDIVFFGESLPDEFHKQMRSDKDECDLLIVIGSSLKVRPVSRIPSSLPPHVPQIIINREPLHKQYTFDVELMGNCDDIISELCNRLGEGWSHLAKPGSPAEEVRYSDLPLEPSAPPSQELLQGGREDVVEHSADSGLGDLETVPQVAFPESCAGNMFANNSISPNARNSDRLERLSSSDSGTESSTALDTQGKVRCPGSTSSKLCSGDQVLACKSSNKDSIHTSGNGCIEVAATEDCENDNASTQDKTPQNSEQSDTSQTSCHDKSTNSSENSHKTSHEDSAASYVDNSTNSSENIRKTCHEDSAATCVDESTNSLENNHKTSLEESAVTPFSSASHHKQCKQTSEVRESLSTCEGPILRKGEACYKRSVDNDSEQKEDSDCHSQNTGPDTPSRHGLHRLWRPRKRRSIASRCKDNQIIFMPPNRYIFPGAEVYSDDSDSDSDDGSHLSISPIPEEVNADTDENHILNMCQSPSSSQGDKADDPTCLNQSEHAGASKDKSPSSTPPSSPSTAWDDTDSGQPNSAEEQDNRPQDKGSGSKKRGKTKHHDGN